MGVDKWRVGLITVIDQCLQAVSEGRPHDACAWIGLEEILGGDETKQLWKDPVLGVVASALDQYCDGAGHDRDILFDDVSMEATRKVLLACKRTLEEGNTDFPQELNLYR